MKDFSRQPTRGERALSIVLTAALSILLGCLSIFLAFRGQWIAASIITAIFVATLILFFRAAFGASRALKPREKYAFAWLSLLLGVGSLAIALFIQGSVIHRLMVIPGSFLFLVTGLIGVQKRGHDA